MGKGWKILAPAQKGLNGDRAECRIAFGLFCVGCIGKTDNRYRGEILWQNLQKLFSTGIVSGGPAGIPLDNLRNLALIAGSLRDITRNSGWKFRFNHPKGREKS